MVEKNIKQIIIDNLSNYFIIDFIRGRDVVKINQSSILYIRYNKNSGQSKNLLGKFWFGITVSEYNKYIDIAYDNFYIVLACLFFDKDIDYIIIPADVFEYIKKDIPIQSGQWKFNLFKTIDNRYFLHIPHKGKFDITTFLNNFDFTTRPLRKQCYPTLGEFSPLPSGKIETQKDSLFPPPSSLSDELLRSVRDSDHPKSFEIALEKFFIRLGFAVERIGRPGYTDILVSAPARFIVEGKSTKMPSLSALNFTRIKRHMKEQQANFAIVISVGFDPSVCKDADMEGVTLLDTQLCVTLLRLHEECPLSPFDYIDIFQKPGIITSDRFTSLINKKQDQENYFLSIKNVLMNLDYQPRNIDELKGRIDYYCENNKLPIINKNQLLEILYFLKSNMIGLVDSIDDQFFLKYNLAISRDKLKHLIRSICNIIT